MEDQKSVAELTEMEESARPAFQKALAQFNDQSKSYRQIKKDLQEAIKFTLNEYCKIFGALDQRARQLNTREIPVIHEISHNASTLSDLVDEFYEMGEILDVSDPSQDLYRSGFSSFYSDRGNTRLYSYLANREDLHLVIPTRYLSVDGIRLMHEDADRIGAEIDRVEESHRIKKEQEKEARERAEFERLRRKFS